MNERNNKKLTKKKKKNEGKDHFSLMYITTIEILHVYLTSLSFCDDL